MERTICRSCSMEAEFVNNICTNCGFEEESNNGNTSKKSIVPIKSATRPKIQIQVELAATVDRTGSSQAFAVGIPETLRLILEQLSAKAKTIRVWLQSHGDLDYGEKAVLLTDGGTPGEAMKDVQKIVYEGGGDAEESHLDGLETLLKTVPWTLDPLKARGALLMFASSGSKPAKSGIKPKELGEQIQKKGLLLYLVCEPTPELQELRDAASGLMFQITNTPKEEELQKIASQLAASIVASVQSGSTVPIGIFENLQKI